MGPAPSRPRLWAEEGFLTAFQETARQQPERLFARFADDELQFGGLEQRSASLAAWFVDQGLGPGQRVAVMMDASAAAIITIFALARACLVWVPLNTRQRGNGLRYVLEHCQPSLLIADQAHLDVIERCGATLPTLQLLHHPDGNGSLDRALLSPSDQALPATSGATLFAIMYTSGTTGPPKGACVTHAMMRFAGEAVARITEPRPGDVFFLWEPLFHIGGAQLLMLPLIGPASLALQPRFSASSFWQQVRDVGASHIHFLGGILQILIKQPPRPDDRSHKVRMAWGGGCPREIWRDVETRFGLEIRECYGMTEASSVTTFNASGAVGAVGRAVEWLTVAIQGSSGPITIPGERGEIVVAAAEPAALFAGYFNNPEASAKALRDGRLWTGDVGSWDARGNLIFHGRMTDSFRVRGENVAAWEVEQTAAAHPAVADCAAIAVAAEIGEQEIKLFVQLKPDCELGFGELTAWLSERLAPYQVPRYLALHSEFERTPSQRIMKHRLSTALSDTWDRLGRQGTQL